MEAYSSVVSHRSIKSLFKIRFNKDAIIGWTKAFSFVLGAALVIFSFFLAGFCDDAQCVINNMPFVKDDMPDINLCIFSCFSFGVILGVLGIK